MEPFSPDSRFALIADFTDASDHSVTSPAFISWHWKMDVWDLEQDAQTVSLERSSQLAYVSEEIEVRFSRDGSRVFCFPNGFVWDARTGKIVLEKPGDGAQLSQDEAKMLASDPRGALFLYDARTGERLALLSAQGNTISAFALSPDGTQVLTAQDKAAFFWARRRPEYWWGVAWLPEFWLTILFAGGLAWSVRRDRRTL
jgi:WD40 repeat protein